MAWGRRRNDSQTGGHRHDDHGRTYTDHRRGRLVLVTTCSKCGAEVAVDDIASNLGGSDE